MLKCLLNKILIPWMLHSTYSVLITLNPVLIYDTPTRLEIRLGYMKASFFTDSKSDCRTHLPCGYSTCHGVYPFHHPLAPLMNIHKVV